MLREEIYHHRTLSTSPPPDRLYSTYIARFPDRNSKEKRNFGGENSGKADRFLNGSLRKKCIQAVAFLVLRIRFSSFYDNYMGHVTLRGNEMLQGSARETAAASKQITNLRFTEQTAELDKIFLRFK